MQNEFGFSPIGIVRSCFKEKFGIPRQPRLIPEVAARIELLPPYDREETLAGMEAFSHLWIVFVFHAALREEWKPTVRPPQLGGNTKVGVFASRSPFRPNPIGMSAVDLERIEGAVLHIRGADLLDGTPVLDIKPYLPYSDRVEEAVDGFEKRRVRTEIVVRFTPDALKKVEAKESSGNPGLKEMIEMMLSLDPRPAYRNDADARVKYGVRIFDFDLKWRIEGEDFVVYDLEDLS